MSEVNPSRNNPRSLPNPTKTLLASDPLKGTLKAYELKPSDYKVGGDRLVMTVADNSGQTYFVNIATGGGEAYAQCHEIITKVGLGANLDISVSQGYEGRTVKSKYLKSKPVK